MDYILGNKQTIKKNQVNKTGISVEQYVVIFVVIVVKNVCVCISIYMYRNIDKMEANKIGCN